MRPPLKMPYFCTACTVYSEQVGQYLQEAGNMGETNLRYTPMTPMKICRGRI